MKRILLNERIFESLKTLLEKRRNADVNNDVNIFKEEVKKVLSQLNGMDNMFMSFRDGHHVTSINLKSDYSSTPNGLYCYPLKVFGVKIKQALTNVIQRNGQMAFYEIFEHIVPWIPPNSTHLYFFKWKGGNALNVENGIDMKGAIKVILNNPNHFKDGKNNHGLLSIKNYDPPSKYFENREGHLQSADRTTDFSKIYGFLAQYTVNHKHMSAIFKKMGYDAIWDFGNSQIHGGQPAQCVFFNPKRNLEMVGSISEPSPNRINYKFIKLKGDDILNYEPFKSKKAANLFVKNPKYFYLFGLVDKSNDTLIRYYFILKHNNKKYHSKVKKHQDVYIDGDILHKFRDIALKNSRLYKPDMDLVSKIEDIQIDDIPSNHIDTFFLSDIRTEKDASESGRYTVKILKGDEILQSGLMESKFWDSSVYINNPNYFSLMTIYDTVDKEYMQWVIMLNLNNKFYYGNFDKLKNNNELDEYVDNILDNTKKLMYAEKLNSTVDIDIDVEPPAKGKAIYPSVFIRYVNQITNAHVNNKNEINRGYFSALRFSKGNFKGINFKDIEKINISAYKIPQNIGLFENLEYMRIFILGDNKFFNEVPRPISKLQNLKTLSILTTSSFKLSRSVIEIKSLEQLDVSWTSNIFIPRYILSLPNLKVLQLREDAAKMDSNKEVIRLLNKKGVNIVT